MNVERFLTSLGGKPQKRTYSYPEMIFHLELLPLMRRSTIVNK